MEKLNEIYGRKEQAYAKKMGHQMFKLGLETNDYSQDCIISSCYTCRPDVIIYMLDSENAEFYSLDANGNLAKVGTASGGYNGAIQFLQQQGIRPEKTFRFYRREEDNPFYRMANYLPPQKRPQPLPNQWVPQQSISSQKAPKTTKKRPCMPSGTQPFRGHEAPTCQDAQEQGSPIQSCQQQPSGAATNKPATNQEQQQSQAINEAVSWVLRQYLYR